MRALIYTLLFITLATSLTALEPSKVAYYTTNTSSQNVYVELKDYTTNTLLFRGETFSLAPNDNGIIIIEVEDYPAGGSLGNWTGLNASIINTSTMLDIYVNGTLFSQKRYDQLILIQAEATVLDNSGNFNPQAANVSIGTDDNRWDDVFVGGNTLHIGPNDGDLNNTEMELSYALDTGRVSINSTNVLSLAVNGVRVNPLSGLGNRIVTVNASGDLQAVTALPTGDVVGNSDTQVLTNKTINADDNAITNIENSDIKAGAQIDASKLANGSVSNAELQQLGSITSAAVGISDVQTLTNKSINADNNTITNIDNADIKAGAQIDAAKLANGSVSNTELQQLGAITSAVVGISDAQTLTNKSINADNNTITNIDNADIKASAQIDATKLADGTVTSAELQYINSVTSNVQTQLDGKQPNLPTQTGNSGRYLTTDGTNLSWGTVSGGSGGCDIYGDGSAGDVTITSNTDWSTTPPTNGNYMFNSLTINPGVTLTVASGTVIQSKTTVTNNGTINVGYGTLGMTWLNNRDVLGNTRGAQDGYPSAEVYRRVFKFGPKGGSAGSTGGYVGNETLGGNGGGTLTIFASTGITNSGTISARGQTPAAYPGGNDKPGCGGGGGGFVVLATNSSITNSGTINVSGGNGNAAGSSSDDYGGAGGGGGLIHYISTNASTVGGTATVSGGSKGADDGTGGNNGGNGGAGVGDAGLGAFGSASTNGSAGAVLRTQVTDACSFINN